MLLLDLGLWLLGVVALAHGFDVESKLRETVINSANENGFIFDPSIYSPMAIHTDKLKGYAHLSDDHGLLFALPDGKEGIFTVSNKHCVKAPKTATVKSCLCYQGELKEASVAQGLTTCYARNMVPLCIDATFEPDNTIKHSVTYVNAKGDVVTESADVATVKLSFTADSAKVIIGKKSSPATKPMLESMYRVFYSDVRVNALNVKSHDCVSFDFEGVVYGGELVSYTAFPKNTYGSDCIGACICNFKSLTWDAGVPNPSTASDEETSAGHSIMQTSALKAATGAVCAAAATTVYTA
uniref:Secreted protein n=1 Tax=Panagrellus redivivus TaxID=6233 RepID=A0A7E4VW71_PANRE